MSRQDDDALFRDRRRAVLSALAGVSVCALLPRRSDAAVHSLDWTPAREIVVDKGRRQVTLYRSDGVVRVFPCVLGANPRGHKEREGDNRTPEGRYVIDFKNINSRFFLSVRVSYPNAQDRARARAAGVRPGGNIMIHGMPNEARRPYRSLLTDDWTNGCVAVSNEAMMEIWLATRENTPVVLRA